MTNVVLKTEYKAQYTSYWSTQVSNALLVGEILGTFHSQSRDFMTPH